MEVVGVRLGELPAEEEEEEKTFENKNLTQDKYKCMKEILITVEHFV